MFLYIFFHGNYTKVLYLRMIEKKNKYIKFFCPKKVFFSIMNLLSSSSKQQPATRPSKTPVSVRCPRCVQRNKCNTCARCDYCTKEIQQCTRCIIRNNCESCAACKECEVQVKCLTCAKRDECEKCKQCEACNSPEEKEYILNISKEPEEGSSMNMNLLNNPTAKKIKKKGLYCCTNCFACCKLNEVNDLDVDEVNRNADSYPNHPLWTPTLWMLFILFLIFLGLLWIICFGYIRASAFVNNHTFYKYDSDGRVTRIVNSKPDELPGNIEDIGEERRPWPQYVDYTGSWIVVFMPWLATGVIMIFVVITALIGKGIDVQDRRFQRLLVVTSVILLVMVLSIILLIYGVADYMNGFSKSRAYELHLTQTSTFVLDEVYEQMNLHRLIDVDMIYLIDAERIRLSENIHGKGVSPRSIIDMAINNTLRNNNHDDVPHQQRIGNTFSRFENIGSGIIQSIIATTPIGGAMMVADSIQNIMGSFSSLPQLFDSNPQVKSIDIYTIMKQIEWIRSREYLVTQFSLENHNGYLWMIMISFMLVLSSILFIYYLSDIFYGYVRIKHGFTWDNT